MSSIFAVSSALFLYLSAPAQVLLRQPLPRTMSWVLAACMWSVSWVVLWRVFSFPAALSLALLMVMLGAMALAFLSGLFSAVKNMRRDRIFQRNA
ncbi:hypothetical protein [Neokomagataea anthophila]|uniref:Uncharacterized protein n=1 Tax=Neokomagataea anthophila TaxID=2826925 RepID=A0ABS5E4H1_9PROT|nr:hypothetical protein [Neokomagataea anthophila]MBR0558793.1 hypothetical protein [Neokomagataea anthophila]